MSKSSRAPSAQSKAASQSAPLHSLDLIVPAGSQVFPHDCSEDHSDAMVMAKPNYDIVVHGAPQHEGSGALTPMREHSPGALTPLRDVGASEGNISSLYPAELSPHSRNYEVVLHDPHSRKVQPPTHADSIYHQYRIVHTPHNNGCPITRALPLASRITFAAHRSPH